MLVDARYTLPLQFRNDLRTRPIAWGFGPLSEAVYFRTYSRSQGGAQETWADTVTRTVEGVMSIRKDWALKRGEAWSDKDQHGLAMELADAIYDMKLLPPGRGLWVMGTDYIYERGSHALNNCGAVDVRDSLADAASWLMDSLMCGVGVGFTTQRANIRMTPPDGSQVYLYRIPDTKEGWATSLRYLIESFEVDGNRRVEFDYSLIRPAGAPIKGFGGTSAGYAPLKRLHEQVRGFCTMRALDVEAYDITRLVADVMNAVGTCVVAGNVRRSAELAVGSVHDETFRNLKNYDVNPDRADIGWMSNNTVALRERDDFMHLGDIAERIADNGEPGILNLMNVRKYGRIGSRENDDAIAINPCGEIPLESKELCNLVEVFPTRCSRKELTRVFQLATFYASTVALLPSHDAGTNAVVERNRRIGVSVSGIADWLDMTSGAFVYDTLNRAYDTVRRTNAILANDAGVPASIRVTTVKPSGTVSLLAGVSSGMHFPVGGHVVRRMRVGSDSPVADLLTGAGVPNEPDEVSAGTTVFEFPLAYNAGRTRSVAKVSVYEQASVVASLQRFWADNAVSNTLSVQPDELNHVERILATFAPQVKSLSLMPDRPNVYPQMPLERTTLEDYNRRSMSLGTVDWSSLHDSEGDAADGAYCSSDSCEVPVARVV